jgi:hypothetical protein
MAWLSMLAGLFFPLLVLSSNSATLGAIATPFYLFVTGVVGAYIGFATVDDKNFKEQ